MITHKAALYLRTATVNSLSIDTQRKLLYDLAAGHGLVAVCEYTDILKSGTSLNRSGFQHMLQDLANEGRAWKTLLVTESSRLSRHHHEAHAFTRQTKAHNVNIIYASDLGVGLIPAILQDTIPKIRKPSHNHSGEKS